MKANKYITITSLTERIYKKTGIPQRIVKEVLNTLPGVMAGFLKERRRVLFKELGIFDTHISPEKVVTNHLFTKTVIIPEFIRPTIKFSSTFLKRINGKKPV